MDDLQSLCGSAKIELCSSSMPMPRESTINCLVGSEIALIPSLMKSSFFFDHSLLASFQCFHRSGYAAQCLAGSQNKPNVLPQLWTLSHSTVKSLFETQNWQMHWTQDYRNLFGCSCYNAEGCLNSFLIHFASTKEGVQHLLDLYSLKDRHLELFGEKTIIQSLRWILYTEAVGERLDEFLALFPKEKWKHLNEYRLERLDLMPVATMLKLHQLGIRDDDAWLKFWIRKHTKPHCKTYSKENQNESDLDYLLQQISYGRQKVPLVVQTRIASQGCACNIPCE